MTITPIRPETTVSPRKQQYLDYVAQAYDRYIEQYGLEPSTIIFGYGDHNGNSSASWLIPDEANPSNLCEMLVVNVLHHLNKTMFK